MPQIIAVDIGTTHCKTLLVDDKGNIHHSFKADIVSQQPQDDRHEQDAAEIYETVIALLQQTLIAAGTGDVAGISFSAAMHSLLAVDENGHALTPAITWADIRARSYAKELRETDSGQNIYEQTGTPVHAMSPLCKLLWMRNEAPAVFHNAHKFISIKEYILFRLCGKFIVDEGIASSSGLYDIYNRRWCGDALKLAGIKATQLSQVVDATHPEQLLAGIKKQLRLEKDIPIIAGGTDGCLANLGCGALQANVAVITTGTSGAVRLTIQKPVRGNMLGLFRYILSNDYYVTGGGTNNAGIVLSWFAENFMDTGNGNNLIDEALQLAQQSPAGSGGLVFLPYLLGERAPVWDESASGVFFGIKMQHRKMHFARAVIEGISFSLVQVLYALEASYQPVERIYASGAVTRSSWWMQMLADASGREVVYQEAADASAFGAAIMGMYATGIISDLQEAQHFFSGSTIFKPDMQLHKLYQQQYKTYIALYPQLKDLF